jgi:predicted  nucleic acid-binding Zn-ribbon protein
VSFCHVARVFENVEKDLIFSFSCSCRLLDDVRMEITAIREINSDLWAQIAEIHAAGQQKLDKNGSTSSSRKRIELLTKVNAQLEHEVSVLCEQLKMFEINREKELADIQSDHDQVIREHEMQLAKMKGAMKAKDKCCEEQRKVFEEKIARQEKLHQADRLRSSEELKRTKESLHEDFSKLKDSLKAAQSACEEETARLNQELDIMKQEKDALVRKLRRLARQGDVRVVPRDERARKEEVRLDRDEMTATHNVVPTKPREMPHHRGRDEKNANSWATKPVWVKEGSFWVKNE